MVFCLSLREYQSLHNAPTLGLLQLKGAEIPLGKCGRYSLMFPQRLEHARFLQRRRFNDGPSL